MITFLNRKKHETELIREGHLLGYLHTYPDSQPYVILTDRTTLLQASELWQILERCCEALQPSTLTTRFRFQPA